MTRTVLSALCCVALANGATGAPTPTPTIGDGDGSSCYDWVTSAGSCYHIAGEGYILSCDVAEADCSGYDYPAGFLSGYSGCCHCGASCNHTLETGSDCMSSYYDSCPPPFTIALSLGISGMSCSEYGTPEEAVVNQAIALFLDGVAEDDFSAHTCTDQTRRGRALKGASDSISISTEVTVDTTEYTDDNVLGAVVLAIAVVVSSGELASSVVSFASAAGVSRFHSVGFTGSSVVAATPSPVASPTPSPVASPTPPPAPTSTNLDTSPTPAPTSSSPTTQLCTWAPTYEASICETVGGVCYSSEDSCALAGGGEFASEGCGSGECGCCYKFPTSTTVDAGADNAQCIDCGRRLSGRKLLFGHLNCC